jgi:signal transduction histidine kinase
MRTKKENNKNGIRMQWKLLVFLLAFVVFVLGVIWVFQIRLLGGFYRNAKYREMDTVTGIIQACLDSEIFLEAVESCAAEYDTCIRIFKQTENQVFAEATSADVSSVCTIHHLTEDRLQYYYQQALINKEDGFTENRESRPRMGNFWSDENRFSTPIFRVDDTDEKIYEIVHSQLMTSQNGTQYMVLLNSVLTPVSATVKTLETQFIWICAVLLVGACLLAFIISRNISRPICDMNKAAKQLALGRYDADFNGYGYREIRELGQSLTYASSELSKLDNLQKELIANVSHDLRTPLTMIRGYAEMMRDIPGENTPENMQVIVDETAHLGDLVTDLLDLSKLRAGSRTPTYENFDLTETVKEVMDRYDCLVRAEGYEISFDYTENVTVRADRMMILQVIYNLINNAVNYVGEDKRVRVVQEVRGEAVRISVIDNGKGIAPEDICLIWDRYYHVDAVHKRAIVGSGLGLSIVKGILELHRSHYGVDSALGHGSTFWFELKREKMEEGEIKDGE